MKSVLRGGLTVLLVGAVGCIAVACGGDDTGDLGLGGSSGAGGKGGSTGTAGSLQNGGSAGTAGSAQNGGSAGDTAGSAGSTAGSAGSAGTAGTNVDAGAKDAPAEATPDSAKEASASDAPASDVSSDGNTSQADAADSGSADAVASDATDGGCPGSQPADSATCTQNMTCDYGNTECACHVVSAGVRKWSCLGADASPPSCPPNNMKPSSGDSCSDAGTAFSCRYGTTWCFCNQADASDYRWDCL
jgi:hypothetical protein